MKQGNKPKDIDVNKDQPKPATSANLSCSYVYPFVLDRAKLLKMLDIMERRFTEAHLKFMPEYCGTLSNSERFYLMDSNELFALDNTVSNPIESLTINTLSMGTFRDNPQPSIQCRLEFPLFGMIWLNVAASDAKVANELFAELEEQIELAFTGSAVHRFIFRAKSLYIYSFLPYLPIIITFTGLALASWLSSISNRDQQLTSDEVQYFVNRSQQINSFDEKVDVLFELRNRQLAKMAPRNEITIDILKLINIRNFLILLPFLIIIMVSAYLLRRCYPDAVFLWGDYKDYYNELISKRKILWTVVILSLSLGILSNFLVLGLSNYINR